jgi:hypothetical protein
MAVSIGFLGRCSGHRRDGTHTAFYIERGLVQQTDHMFPFRKIVAVACAVAAETNFPG